MERKVTEFIKLHNMLSENDGVIVGVSGGADSMCLLSMLLSLREAFKLRLRVVHINHGIRGESADEDERFVEAFCRNNEVDFEAVHADIPQMAREQGLTEEEAGRNFRYKCFFEACARTGSTKIAVAHNKDDNAETVLFNIARGSGISGLRGISPVRKEKEAMIIRPLLCCTRAEIEEYLANRGISFRTDETNLTDEYSRNKIRHNVLPALKKGVNTAVSAHIAELAGQAAELEELVGELTENQILRLRSENKLFFDDIAGEITRISVDAEELKGMNRAVRKGVLRRLVAVIAGSLKDIESSHILSIEELIEKGVGRIKNLPYGILARRDYTKLVLEKKDKTPAEPVNTAVDVIPGEYRIGEKGVLRLSTIAYEKTLNIPKNNYTKFFDYDKIKGDIVVRTRLTGDYLCVRAGKNGSEDALLHRKSLKTWMVDRKIPGVERDEVLLLAEGSHILWILGDRGDDSCLVTDDTKKILKAEWSINE